MRQTGKDDIMTGFRDLHVHTVFSDGANTPEEMVQAAIEKGMAEIGISDHSYTAFDESYCLGKERLEEYRAEIGRLKEAYREKIRVRCGIEQDIFSGAAPEGLDYVIGSVHYIRTGDGHYIPVDETPEILTEAAGRYFGGDIYALTESYYSTEAQVIEKTGAGIIGHFDLITKFLEKKPLFDPENERYRRAWKKAADTLLKTGAVFEINTGAISRGYRTSPYPSEEIRKYLASRGGKFILSSDSHDRTALCCGFETLLSHCCYVGPGL